MMKKPISLLGAISLVTVVLIPNAHAGAQADKTSPTQSLAISENVLVSTMPPAIFGSATPSNQNSWMLCKTFDDAVCSAAIDINYFNHLPPCGGDVTVDCIKSVWATSGSGQKTEASFVKYVAPDNPSSYAAIPALGVPLGKGLGSIWDFPGVINDAGTTTYLLDAALNVRLQGSGPLLSRTTSSSTFNAVLSPVKEIADPKNDTHSIAVSATAEHGLGANGFAGAMNGTCAGHAPSICFQQAGFPAGYRFGFSMTLTKGFQGWFHGRFFAPTISVTKSGQQLISVEAEPVTVPSLEVSVPTTSISKELSDYLFNGRIFGMAGKQIISKPSGADAFDLASLFLPYAKDTATKSATTWAFKTLEWNQGMGNVQNCTASDGGVSGVVTTNALVYSAGPPAFDAATSSLNYKLLSPHYQADGKLAVGTYDLLLRSTVARCIYKFSSAPIKASIEVLSADGNAQVASTVLVEENGWLKMSAKGFGYSSPTVKVTLSQDKALNPLVSSSKQKTITCTKGKTTKKVTALKPVCPKGYVKK